MNIYLQLTRYFNEGRLRSVISSGQAVVLHRLAIMSKDGDWILQEDVECLRHVLDVLGNHKAHYRYGAPLDVRWIRGGWSAHLEFAHEGFRNVLASQISLIRTRHASASDIGTFAYFASRRLMD